MSASRAFCLLAAFGCLPMSARADSQPTVVTFPAADGVSITADWYPPSASKTADAPIAILIHGARSDRAAWRPLVEPLHAAGFAVLAPDLRGHGDSATTETRQQATDREPALFRDMQSDLRGAYDWLAGQPGVDRARFVLCGADLGVSVGLQYASKDCSVDAVVGLSPVLSEAGLDAAGDVHQIRGRHILLLATADERDAPYTLKSRGENIEVQINDRRQAHGTDLLTAVPDAPRDIVRFVSEHVGPASSDVVYGTINSNIYHLPQSGWIAQIAPTNLRYYSSAAEAESRGLRASKSKGPRTGDQRRR